MAATVDPFSYATAELSAEYMGVFHHPDIVPKYLEMMSDKIGFQLFTNFSTVCVKGSWDSLKRAHSFLREFLSSYQAVELDEDGELQKEFQSDVRDKNRRQQENTNEPLAIPCGDGRAKYKNGTGERSHWMKWTAEILPQIQRTRTKQSSVYTEGKPNAKKVPDPLVLYANCQPSPDLAANRPPTLDAIGKVLKQVYDKERKVLSDPASIKNNELLFIENADSSQDHQCVGKSTNKSSVIPSGDISAKSPTQASCTNFDKGQETTDSVALDTTHIKFDHTVAKVSRTQPDITETFALKTRNGVSNQQTHLDISEITDSGRSTTTLISTQQSCANRNPDEGVMEKLLYSQQPSAENQGQLQTSNESGRKCVSTAFPYSDGKQTEQSKLQVSESCRIQTQLKVKMINSTAHEMPPVSEKMSKKLNADQPAVPMDKKRKGRPMKNVKYKKAKEESPAASTRLRVGRIAPQRSARELKIVGHRPSLEGKPTNPTDSIDIKDKEFLCEQNGRKKKQGPTIAVREGRESFRCKLCSYAANKLSHLHEHNRRVHLKKEFKCEKCEKIFGFKKDLKRHCQTHQKAENCCDVCGKMYKGIRTLAEHKKTHDLDYVKPEFPCEFCQKNFSTKYVLAYHIKSEHLGMKKTYLCPMCGKSFSQKNSYLQHANVHLGIKPYQCDTCGRSFSYEKSLKEHKYMHNEDKQFECPVCHKRFRQSSGVAIHMKIHKERKDYVCSACGKGFSQKQAMIRHERIHIGEKPFACALCHRTFTDSSILRRHMILIHKKDPKKWREDTENNVQRRTDFFIGLVAKHEKGKELRAASHHCDTAELTDNSNKIQNKSLLLTSGDSQTDHIKSNTETKSHRTPVHATQCGEGVNVSCSHSSLASCQPQNIRNNNCTSTNITNNYCTSTALSASPLTSLLARNIKVIDGISTTVSLISPLVQNIRVGDCSSTALTSPLVQTIKAGACSSKTVDLAMHSQSMQTSVAMQEIGPIPPSSHRPNEVTQTIPLSSDNPASIPCEGHESTLFNSYAYSLPCTDVYCREIEPGAAAGLCLLQYPGNAVYSSTQHTTSERLSTASTEVKATSALHVQSAVDYEKLMSHHSQYQH